MRKEKSFSCPQKTSGKGRWSKKRCRKIVFVFVAQKSHKRAGSRLFVFGFRI